MAVIQNIDRLQRKLEKLENKYSGTETTSAVVGYTANYGVYVHERPARHAPGKQAKFLEQPARNLDRVMGRMIAKALGDGVKLLQALYLAGLRLQRDSQQIVPVDTGNLRASAFTAREDDLESVMAVGEGKTAIRVEKQAASHEKKMLKKALTRSTKRMRQSKGRRR
jgi:hypothetical protein